MTLIDKAEALATLRKHANGKTVLGGQVYQSLTLETALEAINALPARGVGVPEIDGWVRRLRKTEEAGHVHHLSKADRLAIADFLAALAPTDYTLAPHLQKIVDGAKTAPQWDTQADRLAPTDAAHVNETLKSEHDAGNVLTAAQAREAARREAWKNLNNHEGIVIECRDDDAARTWNAFCALIGEDRT